MIYKLNLCKELKKSPFDFAQGDFLKRTTFRPADFHPPRESACPGNSGPYDEYGIRRMRQEPFWDCL